MSGTGDYTYVLDDEPTQPTTQELKLALQKGSDEVKLDVLRRVIILTLNGAPHPDLLMPIIQYVLPSKSKAIKKLLHFYWEVCPKLDDNGKLKQEMILVCNAIRNDLQHPNEYIRGATLRFLQKVQEPELLEPLIPTTRACLEHRHSYVRKNAVLAVYQIYQRHGDNLIPDAPELIHTFLIAETDSSCRRNAFVMLIHCAMPRAVDFFLSIYDGLIGLDEQMQLAVIELIRTDIKTTNGETTMKSRYIRAVFELLGDSTESLSVRYEAAALLTSLTSNPAAVKAAASAYIDLIIKESDNNVKTIVLDRVESLRAKHDRGVLDDLVMDILRVLGAPDMEVKRKCLDIALELVSSRNVEDVVLFLKKELSKTLDANLENKSELRQLLIQSIHQCAIKFSEVAANVVHVLLDFLGDSNNTAAVDVISFVREVVEKFPSLRKDIVDKLRETLTDIKSGKVFRGALWILGEYSADAQDLTSAMQQIRAVLGEVPIVPAEQRLLETAEEEARATEDAGDAPKPQTKTKVLADGTYATETVFSSTVKLDTSRSTKPPLRALVLGGDFYTASVLASTLAKIVLRFSELSTNEQAVNALRAEAMLIMTSLIRVGQSKFSAVPIDEDSVERISTCLESLAHMNQDLKSVFLKDTQKAYTNMIAHEEKKKQEARAKESKDIRVQADDLISFRQFSKKAAGDTDEYDLDISKATGAAEAERDDFMSKLNKVVQLTGFSDPVYAEAYVNVHQFDVDLDVLIVNQTTDTLQNLTVEFATLGDLKISDKPVSYVLGPHSFQSVRTTIKVSSTETGVIFGNIFYDGKATSDSRSVVLNDIHIDILDYIKPAYCNETQFRSMWTEFEWENKVNVNTTISDLRAYLQHIMKCTNMSCLTPDAALSGDCGFLSANMYARSLFGLGKGEDALANLSIECLEDGTLQGHVRIRSKTQGIALSLGDKITLAQKAITA